LLPCQGYTGSPESMDTAKYFQNGLPELTEIWRTEILSSEIFFNFLTSFILKIQG
jgi:hypothetical protein